jgi:hypothetical protein
LPEDVAAQSFFGLDHTLHTGEVQGSIPCASTMFLCGNGRRRNRDKKACECSGKMLGARQAIDAPPAT